MEKFPAVKTQGRQWKDYVVEITANREKWQAHFGSLLAARDKQQEINRRKAYEIISRARMTPEERDIVQHYLSFPL